MTKITLKAENGLHARPATEVVREAMKYVSDIKLVKDNKHVNAKSMISIMSAGFIMGDELQVHAEGADAESAESAVAGLLATIVD